jgi:hypothetical protein
MARRQAENGRLAHLELDDGLPICKADLERLTTCHRRPYDKLDWRRLAARARVALPVRTHQREKAARHALATWQPNWQERLFGDEHRRRQLNNRVFEAAREDEVAFQKLYRAAETHNAETLIACKLLDLDVTAIREAVTLKTRLVEVCEGMNGVSLAQPGGDRVVAIVEAIQEADVPYERISEGDPRSARRELIPLAERRQIHLAAICAAGLRVGADLVSVMPVDAIEVLVCCEMGGAGAKPGVLNPIVQFMMTTKLLSELDWMKDDAVTLATSIGARMEWSIEKGFSPIRIVPMSAMARPLAKSA